MINKVFLVGRLTKDAEIRMAGETKVANFNLAVPKYVKGSDHPNADYFNIIAFGNKANFIENYVKKGTKLIIVGRLQSRTWTDSDGKNRVQIEVLADEIDFGESKSSKEIKEVQEAIEQPTYIDGETFNTIDSDDLPF